MVPHVVNHFRLIANSLGVPKALPKKLKSILNVQKIKANTSACFLKELNTMANLKIFVVFCCIFQTLNWGCGSTANAETKQEESIVDTLLVDNQEVNPANSEVIVASERIKEYLPLLKNKQLALLVNQTSMVHDQHLVDTLVGLGLTIKTISDLI